jgi:hypothetical protein
MTTPRIALTLTTLAALSSPALANGHPDPKLPKEVQAMYCLVGDWTSQNGQATLDGKKHKVDFTVSCAPTSGGFGLLCQAKFDIQGMGHLEETDLFGYDPGQDRYHWFSVTGMGETHDHVALPPKDKDPTITFAYAGLKGGKPMQEVIHLTFNADASKIEFRNDGVVGGQPAWLLSATMVKQ